MAPSAIILAFEGVLCDPENHQIVAWQRTLSILGWQLSEAEARLSVELHDLEFLRMLFEKHGVPDADLEAWIRRKQKLAVSLFRDAPRFYPGARELIEALTTRARLVLVSDTWRENVTAALKAAGLERGFELILAQDEGSSATSVLQRRQDALDQLAIPPSLVRAVEGTPAGASASQVVGIPCVAIGHMRDFGDWVGNATYVSGLLPIQGLLSQLGFEPPSRPDR